MYSDMNNNQNEENDTRQESAMDKALSFLPSAKVLGIIVLIEVLVFAGVMYFKNKDEDSSTTTISLENNPEYVLVNDSRKINFKVNGKTYNGDYSNVTMRLDNSSLASISNGVITTGNVLGSTNITIIYNESMGTGRLIVYMGDKNVNTTDVNIPEGNLAVKVSSSYDIFKSISMTPSNGYVEKIEYFSSDTSKVRVDENGKIEGVALGESEVTVVVNNVIRKSFKVVVTDSDENLGFVTETSTTPSEIQEIKFTQPEITTTNNISTLKLTVNDLYKLVPEIVPANATNKALTYDLFDKTIISVTPSADGTSAEIKALKAGTTSITVKSSNGKIGVLTIIVTKGSSSGVSGGGSGACYCNSNVTRCSWNERKDDMTIKQSQIPNANACSMYAAYSSLCFKGPSGYVWGKFGNTSGYSYTAGVTSSENCTKLNDEKQSNRASLNCTNGIIGGETTCNFTTTVSPYTLSGATSSDTSIATVKTSGATVIVKCTDKGGKVTITATPSNGMGKVSSNVACSKSNMEVICPSQIAVKKTGYISSPSTKVTCSSPSSDITISNLSNGTCKITAGDKAVSGIKVTITSTEKSSITKNCVMSIVEDIAKDAVLECNKNLVENGSSQDIAKCTNCIINSNGNVKENGTYTVTATAKDGHLFEDGSQVKSIQCTVKKANSTTSK